MSADLIAAAKQRLVATGRAYEKTPSPQTRDEWKDARIEYLSVSWQTEIQAHAQTKRKLEQAEATLRIRPDMEAEGFEEIQGSKTHRAFVSTPRQRAEALFEPREAGE